MTESANPKKLENLRFKVEVDRHGADEKEVSGYNILNTETGEHYVGIEGIYGYEDPAIAQLMAKSPQLLEALRYARRFLKKEDVDTDFIDEVLREATTVPDFPQEES